MLGRSGLRAEIVWQLYITAVSAKIMSALVMLETEQNMDNVQGVMRDALTDYKAAIEEDGFSLKTRLEQETLKSIADMTGGRYFLARDERSEDGIVDAILKRARTIEYTRATEAAWFSLPPLLLCAAFILFILGIIAGR